MCLGFQTVGKVSVYREGLYYRIHCRCVLDTESICRLRIRCDGRQENLGILAPVDGGFGLDTKVPVKRIGKGKPEFLLAPKHEEETAEFVPVYPEEPFAYISRLKEAFLVKNGGQTGILLKQKQGTSEKCALSVQISNSSPTGQ